MSSSTFLNDLKNFWVPSIERCGIVLRDGRIIELKNRSANGADEFVMDLEEFEGDHGEIVATWHTHPTTGPNLSVMDYLLFQSKPKWFHYIVAEQEVWCYAVKNGKVLVYDDN